MKDSGNIDDYIQYRIEKAYQSWDDARLLFQNERWNASVNRFYYSVFYAVIALLIKNGVDAKSHNGVRRMFGEKFINTKIVEIKYGKLLSKLSDWRDRGDYGDLFDFSKEQVEPLIMQTKEMLDEIKSLLG